MFSKTLPIKAWVYLCLFVLLWLQATSLWADQPSHPFSAADMMNIYRISDPQISPDGRRLVFSVALPDTDKNSVRQTLYMGTLQEKDFFPVTPPELSATNPRWSYDGQSLYFLAASSGGIQQMWKLSLYDGKIDVMTTFPVDIHSFTVVPQSHIVILSMPVLPGKTLEHTRVYLAERKKDDAGGARIYDRLPVRHWDAWRDGTRNHLFAFNIKDGTMQDLMQEMEADCPGRPFGTTDDYTVSPDGRFVVFSAKEAGQKEAWSTNDDLYFVAVDRPALIQKVTTNAAADIQPRFSPDGKTLAYLAASRPGNEADHLRVVLRDMSSGKEKVFDLRADDTPSGDRSPDHLTWSPDGQQLYLTADHLGHHALFAMDARTGHSSLVMKTGAVGYPRTLPDGRILFGWSSLQRPLELYITNTNSGESQRLTKLNDDRIDRVRFGKTGTFQFNNDQGYAVYGRIIYPVDFDPGKKYPVAFLIHGGPQMSNLNEFTYRWHPQVFAGAGYAVIMIDFPGSTGYGQSYTDAIHRDWGGMPYKDLLSGLSIALNQYPFLDRKRMSALGPSFGGYMVNWIAGHDHPFRCFVSHAGIFDRERFFYETDELWFAEWEADGVPWSNREGHQRQNPLNFVRNWQTPTLLIHGEKDFRVPYSQGLSAFTALQRKGIPSKLVIFPDEGHWVQKPQNILLWYQMVLSWLSQWLSP